MKFRTDFVTNSSDTSYISFNVKNKKMYDYLNSIGIKIESWDEGTLSSGMSVILPSGATGEMDGEEPTSVSSASNASSISIWIMEVIEAFVRSDPFEEPEDPDDDYDEEDAWLAFREAYSQELSDILPPDFWNVIGAMDGEIEEAYIRHEEGFEGTIFVNEEIEVKNGIRLEKTPEDSAVFSESMDNFDYAGKTQEKVIEKKWENGCWVRLS